MGPFDTAERDGMPHQLPPATLSRLSAAAHACEDARRDFVREFPLEWKGRRHGYDFEHDSEKWSVPGRHVYRVVFATWEK